MATARPGGLDWLALDRVVRVDRRPSLVEHLDVTFASNVGARLVRRGEDMLDAAITAGAPAAALIQVGPALAVGNQARPMQQQAQNQ